jgi:plasmid maintenance system antidote protein VapI
MGIKETNKGWEYANIVFKTRADAEAVEKADLDNAPAILSNLDYSTSPVLVYDSDKPTSFGEFVMKHIENHGRSIVAFAKKVNVSKQTFHSWINGSSVPHQEMITKLVELTGVTRKDMLVALQTNFDNHQKRTTGVTDEEYGEVIKSSGKIGTAKIAGKGV